VIDGFAGMRMVGSDSSIARGTSVIGQCCSCGLVQKPITDRWTAEVDEIYAKYDMTQSIDGVVQRIYDARTGGSVARVDAIAARVIGLLPAADPATVLDVGTGNGDFVRSIRTARPDTAVDALEASARYRDDLVSSGAVRTFFLRRPDVAGPYDAVSALHVLEHVPEPSAFLADLAGLLVDGGFIWVQVPNVAVAVNDLLVLDHCSHFTACTLADVVERAGLVTELLEESAGGRELSAVLRRDGARAAGVAASGGPDLSAMFNEMERFRARVHASSLDPWVFGVGNMGAWVAAERDGRIAGFVDEDPVKWGRTFHSRLIVAPLDSALDGATLCIPLWGGRAEGVADRLGAVSRGMRTVAP
jgi:SAM-dependent methyltransferase